MRVIEEFFVQFLVVGQYLTNKNELIFATDYKLCATILLKWLFVDTWRERKTLGTFEKNVFVKGFGVFSLRAFR